MSLTGGFPQLGTMQVSSIFIIQSDLNGKESIQLLGDANTNARGEHAVDASGRLMEKDDRQWNGCQLDKGHVEGYTWELETHNRDIP